MRKKTTPWESEKFILLVLIILCSTILTAIGKMTSEDCQAIIVMALAVVGGANIYKKWQEKKDIENRE